MTVVKNAGEDLADSIVFKNRKTQPVWDLAQTSDGRAAIANAIAVFYGAFPGALEAGAPGVTIGQAFARERPDYVSGKKLLTPVCLRLPPIGD